MDKKKINQELINASDRNSNEDLINIAEKMQSENKRELLIHYEMRISGQVKDFEIDKNGIRVIKEFRLESGSL